MIGDAQQSQLSLEIKTLPTDSDPFAISIARHLQLNLEAVGVDVRLTVMAAEELSRQVLLNHDFDIYIGQFPYTQPPDPDVYYPLLRSTFASEAGWQNPFGLTNLSCDAALDDQRTASTDRRQAAVDELQRLVAQSQPLTPIVSPDGLTGVRTDRFTGWNPDERDPALGGPTQPHNLLQLEREPDQPATLRLAAVSNRLSSNRNPISAAYQQDGSLLDLVYDSVALDQGGEYIPWLAREFTWVDNGGPPEVKITLRDGLQWHDGEQLSAFDVGFTYEFLRDTSLGDAIQPVPSERFRGRISLVDDVSVTNSRELSVTFTETTQAVARRALTVPILPAHIWRRRTRIEQRYQRSGRTTAALTTNNPSAVGSGPLQFEDSGGNVVEFSRFDQHFLWRTALAEQAELTTSTENESSHSLNETNSSQLTGDTQPLSETAESDPTRSTSTAMELEEFAAPPEAYGGLPPFETVTVQTVSSPTAAAELIASGGADATVAMLSPEAVSRIEVDPELTLVESRSNAFYHLGFNTRRQPLGNPNVRRVIAQLVDKAGIAADAFKHLGDPIASPLAGTDWLPDGHRLQWDDETAVDPEVPFLGSDGELSVEQARNRFRAIGYQFTSDNELITQI